MSISDGSNSSRRRARGDACGLSTMLRRTMHVCPCLHGISAGELSSRRSPDTRPRNAMSGASRIIACLALCRWTVRSARIARGLAGAQQPIGITGAHFPARRDVSRVGSLNYQSGEDAVWAYGGLDRRNSSRRPGGSDLVRCLPPGHRPCARHARSIGALMFQTPFFGPDSATRRMWSDDVVGNIPMPISGLTPFLAAGIRAYLVALGRPASHA